MISWCDFLPGDWENMKKISKILLPVFLFLFFSTFCVNFAKSAISKKKLMFLAALLLAADLGFGVGATKVAVDAGVKAAIKSGSAFTTLSDQLLGLVPSIPKMFKDACELVGGRCVASCKGGCGIAVYYFEQAQRIRRKAFEYVDLAKSVGGVAEGANITAWSDLIRDVLRKYGSVYRYACDCCGDEYFEDDGLFCHHMRPRAFMLGCAGKISGKSI